MMKRSSERPVVPRDFFIGLWNGVWLSLPLWGIILAVIGVFIKRMG